MCDCFYENRSNQTSCGICTRFTCYFLLYWVKLNNTVFLLFLVYIYLLSIADLQKRSLTLPVRILPKNLRTSERVHKEETKERNHSPPNIFPALWEDLMCLMNSNIMISDGSQSIIIWMSDTYKVEYIVWEIIWNQAIDFSVEIQIFM